MSSTGEKRAKHYPLLRYFSIGRAIAFAIATTVLAVPWHQASVDRAVHVTQRQNVHLAELMVNAVGAANPEPGNADIVDISRNEPERVHDLLRPLISGTLVLKIKIFFDPEGHLVWSPAPAERTYSEANVGIIQKIMETAQPTSRYVRGDLKYGFTGDVSDREIV